ncbi:Periplasmic serine endoprotease DegP precursor [Nocardiopsis dassonvillei]|uniref:Peptidase S1 and S6 chymotrypsin/Hap n=2 Tax=Nocardiopsis dassonvillei TaxID=2014 RepID=D7B6J8_NOCDD|nr:peptidase S1 and S6 chymotrypsin/Hap [Nocardiopsis dassonvillei subsp. dassonvillei DSM 43111]VEI89794.1 Periplasmic serine endoprotease DegP precursor [Nocardiopsis dassonvillei]
MNLDPGPGEQPGAPRSDQASAHPVGGGFPGSANPSGPAVYGASAANPGSGDPSGSTAHTSFANPSGPGHPGIGGPSGPANPMNPGAPSAPGQHTGHTGQSAAHGGYATAFQAGHAAPGPGAPPPGVPGPHTTGPHSAPQPPAPKRPRRGVPVWMALSGMLVVALIAGGAGGVAGNLLDGSSTDEAAQEEGPVMNEPPPEAPRRDPDTIAGVAQRVSPSVVFIHSADPTIPSSGSGFVIDGNYVVTNDHVSAGLEADGIVVEYSDGSLSSASVVGSDPSSDLAVLSLDDPIDVEPLQFGDSEQVIVGDEVIAIGAPLGLSGTVTQGIISAVNRPVSSGEGENASRFYALQTDAAINPGNSGGPLVDLEGRVIGVNSMIVTMSSMGEPTGNIGLGFAIPSVEAERVVNRLVEYGETSYADIGAEIDLDSPVAGAVIADGGGAVESGGPADEAGLEPGDVILSLDGRPVNSGQELLAMLRSRSPGEEVEVEFDRDGRRDTVTVTLGSSD